MNILNHFKLYSEKEDYREVIENIDKGVVFRGTNLWILVFAIFIASLGLNVNSTAVIIGAMLVSPLMGPIMGLGLGMAINDLALLKKSAFNYLFAAGVGLATSTLYFLITPINDAHSEILARTAPTIYDVLIAFFGGLAGILATSSKQKGNVIPGVAIATALMPPLCTAGYGLATFKFSYFFGAFYLFLINTVFIALATLITAKFLKFPFKELPDKEDSVRTKRIVWIIVIVTILPSIYFGYDIVKKNKYQRKVDKFIDTEAIFPNDYLLKKNVDVKKKSIELTYGGEYIEETEIEKLKSKLKNYDLEETSLEIRQGFAYLKDDKNENNKETQLSLALNEKELQILSLKNTIDSIDNQNKLSGQIFKELKAQYPSVTSSILQPSVNYTDTVQSAVWVSIIKSDKPVNKDEKEKIENWLHARLSTNSVTVHFD